jgi:DNA-binding NarL/FixJ family response regulator
MAVQGRAAICCSDGIEATRRITADHSGTRVVTLTMLVDAKMVLAAMRAGASGYVLKGAEQNELLRVVRVVAAGEMLFGASVARSTYCSRRATPRPRSSRSRNSHDGSVRDLLALVPRGATWSIVSVASVAVAERLDVRGAWCA